MEYSQWFYIVKLSTDSGSHINISGVTGFKFQETAGEMGIFYLSRDLVW